MNLEDEVLKLKIFLNIDKSLLKENTENSERCTYKKELDQMIIECHQVLIPYTLALFIFIDIKLF